MAGLKDTTIAGGYKSLIRLADNTGVGSSQVQCTDGDGSNLPMLIAESGVVFTSQSTDGNTLEVDKRQGGDNVFRVNTNTPFVQALGHHVNTQYAYFGASNIDTADFTVNTHMAIPFNSQGYGDLGEIPAFGTSTDPAATFTTAEANATRASDLVPCLWLVPDDIEIDNIYAFVGADTATGDTTRIHLFQYTFSSGSTSALTSGSVIAHSTSDTTNAGSEQAYKTTLSKDETSIDAGKVILAFFRSDSINSDFSINITVKYHLR